MLSSLFFTELIECSDTPPPPVHAAHGAGVPGVDDGEALGGSDVGGGAPRHSPHANAQPPQPHARALRRLDPRVFIAHVAHCRRPSSFASPSKWKARRTSRSSGAFALFAARNRRRHSPTTLVRETLALSAWRTVRCSQLCAAPRSVRIASSASHHACQPRRKQLPRHSFTAWCSRRTSVRCAATPSCHVEKARRRENGPVFRLATNAGAAARDASLSGCRRVRGRALALALAIVATLRARSLSTPRGSWPANGAQHVSETTRNCATQPRNTRWPMSSASQPRNAATAAAAAPPPPAKSGTAPRPIRRAGV